MGQGTRHEGRPLQMTFSLLFVVLVVVGFAARFMATFPIAYAERVAWACWLIAAVLWSFGST